jgi:phosphatidylglycerophosphate synthase
MLDARRMIRAGELSGAARTVVSPVEPGVETAALAGLMVDPLNRVYRYRVAYWLLQIVRGTRITPNQVTVFHGVLGLAAAGFVAQGSDRGLVVAFLLSEARMVLDCLDGVLARAKRMTSPRGRALDATTDAVSYVALCAGIWMHAHLRAPGAPVGTTLVLAMLACGLMSWVHDFYRRKFASALKSGTDGVYDELRDKLARIRAGDASFAARFAFLFDWLQVVVLASATRREIEARLFGSPAGPAASEKMPSEVHYILKNAHSRTLRVVVRTVGLMAGENAIAIYTFSLLAGSAVNAPSLVLLYCVLATSAGVLATSVFMHGSRRAVESET